MTRISETFRGIAISPQYKNTGILTYGACYGTRGVIQSPYINSQLDLAQGEKRILGGLQHSPHEYSFRLD